MIYGPQCRKYRCCVWEQQQLVKFRRGLVILTTDYVVSTLQSCYGNDANVLFVECLVMYFDRLSTWMRIMQ